MTDWYTEGYESLIEDMASIVEDMLKDGSSPREIAATLYGTLVEDGFVDYDTEKDIFYDWFGPENDAE